MLCVRVPPEDTMAVIGLIMLCVRVPPEDTVDVIGLIMLFVRVPPEDTMGVIGSNGVCKVAIIATYWNLNFLVPLFLRLTNRRNLPPFWQLRRWHSALWSGRYSSSRSFPLQLRILWTHRYTEGHEIVLQVLGPAPFSLTVFEYWL